MTFLNAAVTDLTDAMWYCEYKIPLSLRWAKSVPSEAPILGTKAHHKEEEYEREHANLEPVLTKDVRDAATDRVCQVEHLLHPEPSLWVPI